MSLRTLALVALLALAPVAQAATLSGHVVGIADGDTITVLDEAKAKHRVRLAGIDAPEKAQPFGQKSKQYLSDIVMGELVTVQWSKRDRSDQIVGKVFKSDGRDACLEQIRAGLAWWFRKHADEQSPEDRAVYERAETAARAARVGLWIDPEPMAPWDWRNKNK